MFGANVDWLGSFETSFDLGSSYRASTGINVGYRYHYVYTEWYNVAWLPESGEIESYCLDRIDQDVELRYYLRKDYELIRRKSPDYNFYRPYNEITVHGTTYLVSKRPDDSGARLKIGDAVYYYSSEGFLSHILWNGEIYVGTEIQKFFAQKFNVDNPVTLWEALYSFFDPGNINAKNQDSPYKGPYNGIGNHGFDYQTHWGHAQGISNFLDFINWLENNPEEAEKMVEEYLNFLNSFTDE